MLKRKPASKVKLSTSQTIILGFLVVILIGAILLMLPLSNSDGNWMNFWDALFSSVSSVCITGLMVIDVATQLTLFGQIVVLFLVQIGALGFMTIATFLFILIGKKIRLKERMLIKETLGHDSYNDLVRLARNIIIATFVIEFAGAVALLPSMLKLPGGTGTAIFRSIFLSISSFCNAGIDIIGAAGAAAGGFSTFALSPLVLLPVAFLIVIGGLGFAVIFDVMKIRRGKKAMLHTRIVICTTLALIVGGAIIIAVAEWSNPETLGKFTPLHKIFNALFASISPRTAGYTTFSVSDMTPAGKALTAFLGIIGAAPASTGGGIKVTTFFILILAAVKGTSENNDLIYRKQTIRSNVVHKSFLIFFLAVALIFIFTLALCLIEGNNAGVSFESLLFETVNAFSTAGMSFGITPLLSRVSLMILAAAMFVGRLGTLALALSASERKSRENENLITYPDGKVMVG